MAVVADSPAAVAAAPDKSKGGEVMGFFGKKEPCPVCGGDVKGLFLIKIGGKQTLCKDCSKQVSMHKELLQNATPEFIQEHLAYRQKNAEKYNALRWDVQYTDVPGLKVGVDPGAGFLYLVHDELHDEKNPVVFSFGQITGYELYRLNKKVDDADTPGKTYLESTLSALAGIAQIINKDSNATDYFKLKLTTSDPYWPGMELKISFVDSQLYGRGGFGEQMEMICQMLKRIVRKEPVSIF